jgi:phosphoribosylglycinamide formyltransferase-1
MKVRVAILASGSGTNAENIVNYFKDNNNVEIAMIASNKPGAYVLERAKKLDVPYYHFTNEELKEGMVANQLILKRIDFVVLAGFLQKIPSGLIQVFPNRIINIHPALLPNYGGKGMYGDKVHQAVIEKGDKQSGISIHYVNENYDEGAIIFQAKCEVNENDTPESLAKKIHELEYKHFPKVIEEVIEKINA